MKIKLNKDFGKFVERHEYELDPYRQYVIDMDSEIKQQSAIYAACSIMGGRPLHDYYDYLHKNKMGNYNRIKNYCKIKVEKLTNEHFSQFWGKGPLWKTEYSQGLVVKGEDGDFYILCECSYLVTGYKYSQIVCTPGGCM